MAADSQLAFASIREIGKLFRSAKLSPVELTRSLLARIEKYNPELNAYITVTADVALRQAKTAESELGRGRGRSSRRDRGPLHGIPISLKDNIHTAGIPTTAGAQILRNFIPGQNAPVVTALERAGAVLLGKTNMHEFAYGITSNNPHFGAVRNPWDAARTSGGSSGGSAAALAAGLCYGSIGTDTGGSIRVPSSLCGTVGLKTSLGLVSAEGIIPLSPTLDTVGPMARTAADAGLLLDAMLSGASRARRSPRARASSPPARRLRLGLPDQFFFEDLSPQVQSSIDHAIGLLRKHGVAFETVSLPAIEASEDAGNRIAWAEALLYHQQSGWFPDRAAEYGDDVRTRLELGRTVTAIDYLEALQARKRLIAQFHSTFREHKLDAIVVPTTPITAPPIGDESVSVGGKSLATRAFLLRNNRPANLGGFPAISLPCGLTRDNLPVGLQFMGPLQSDHSLLALAQRFERQFGPTGPNPVYLH